MSSEQMDREKARRVLEEVSRRADQRKKVDFDKLAFGPQLAFINDPSKLKAALTSRRAGKSTAAWFLICHTAQRFRNATILYITLTRSHAKRILWQLAQEMSRRIGIRIKLNAQDLSITFIDTGTICYLCGADDEAEIERFRGGKYPLVILDEAQSFRPYIEALIKDIIEPALMDYDGTLCVTGTPGPIPAGFFFDVTTDRRPGWSVHKWTVLDNPYIPEVEAWLAAYRTKHALTEDDPSYMREYRGLWVLDSGRLVYRLQDMSTIPKPEAYLGKPSYVLGIDLGYVDSTAFVVLQYSPEAGKIQVLESYKVRGLIPSAVAVHVERLLERYNFHSIVADSGGLGKGYVEEMKQRFQLPIRAAKKTDKFAYIELLNGDLRTGRLKIARGHGKGNDDLLHEMWHLQWADPEHTDIDDQKTEDHLCDALLYGWRECRAYLPDYALDIPKPGDRDFEDWLEAKVEAGVERQNKINARKRDQVWWDEIGDEFREAHEQPAQEESLLLFPLHERKP